MKIIVTGSAGLLGSEFVSEGVKRRHRTVGFDRTALDVTDLAAVRKRIAGEAPDWVVHCAAYTAVDGAEEARASAMLVNREGAENVARAASRVGARMVYISSDYVFDGKKRMPYEPSDATGPLSVYGESKLEGERQALRHDRALVLRASWLFGPGGPNFVATMRRLAGLGNAVGGSNSKPLRVVDDQVGCPTYTPFLARAIWDLLGAGATGTIHYCNRDAVSWYGFAREILGPGPAIEPVTTDEFPRPAPRPAYSVLAVDRFEETVGRRVEPWIHGLATYLEHRGEA